MSVLKLYPNDTVALATTDLKKGDVIQIDGKEITLLDDVPSAHKVAVKDFAEGEAVTKYDNIIGYTTQPVKCGEWVHLHNIRTGLSQREYTYDFNEASVFPGTSDKTFMGYDRADGGAGIRNHVAIISTVFCANGVLRDIYEEARDRYPANDHFDGFVPLTQEFGCSQTGEDSERMMRIVAGVARNANWGGVLLVSLGCEVMIPKEIEKYMGDYDKSRIRIITIQKEEDELAVAQDMIDEIMKEVDKDRRTEMNVGRLHIAMNCGGSDGHSGITANTLVGHFCDHMVADGATMNMTEVPEMFGAEHILMNRAANKEVFDDMVKMVNDYKAYFIRYGEDVENNATQGNRTGGLSTLEDKSLGCIQKGGHCAVMEVLPYGGRATSNGFVLVTGPGNDLAGITAQIAAGAVLTIFTTGRGTPCGFAGPTFRVSSNTALYNRKRRWIDYDAGRLLEAKTPEAVTALDEELYDQIMDVINGNQKTCNEKNKYYMMGCLKDGVLL